MNIFWKYCSDLALVLSVLCGFTQSLIGADSDGAKADSGSENRSASTGSESSKGGALVTTVSSPRLASSPRAGDSPRTNSDDGSIIIIDNFQKLAAFLAHNDDLAKIKQLIISDINRENSVSLTTFLALNAKELTSLAKLTLRNLPLEASNSTNLVTILNEAKSIKELRLVSNQLTGEGFSKLKKKLAITKLEIIDNPLSEMALNNLKYLFSALDNLLILSLKDSIIADADKKLIKPIAASLSKIVQLDLSGTKINAQTLAALLKKTSTAFKHLDLSNNDFAIMTGPDITIFGNILKNLDFLLLAQCNIDVTLVHTLAALLTKETKVKTLDLSSNVIGNQGLHLVVLNFAKSLEKLVVKKNGFDKSALFYLKDNAIRFGKLKALDLSDNDLSGGMESLNAMATTPLKTLKLARANLQDNDFKFLAHFINESVTLSTLNLEYNRITEAALKFLRQIQNNKTTLKLITLHTNEISNDVFEQFATDFAAIIKGCQVSYTGLVGQI